MDEILNIIKSKGITRLCHFTKSKNLSHIINDFDGILATSTIPEPYKDVTDFQRLDGKLDHICCSIQYPNLFYFDRIKDNDKLFKDWIILSINPEIMTMENTLFSKVNAATGSGIYIKPGIKAFEELFSNNIETHKRGMSRSMLTPLNCPTDFQAEVLIYKKIPREYIEAIIVKDSRQALEEEIRMELWGVENMLPIIIAPELFDKSVYKKISVGQLPIENQYKEGNITNGRKTSLFK